MAKMIAELERSIAQYKEEYAVLISEAQAIKADLTAVESKVLRCRLNFSCQHQSAVACNGILLWWILHI